MLNLKKRSRIICILAVELAVAFTIGCATNMVTDEIIELKPVLEQTGAPETDNSNDSWTVVDSVGSVNFDPPIIVYNSLDDLKALVYDEAKMIEREFEFDDISALNISTGADNVIVTNGGDKLLIRYYEWLENEYSINITERKLMLFRNNIPFIKTANGTTNAWLSDYLRSQGKTVCQTIEIMIPASLAIDSVEIQAGSGTVVIQDCELNYDVSVSAGSGDIYTVGCDFENISFSTGTGQVYVEDCTFDIISISTSSGNGNIKLTDSIADYNVSFNSSKGKLIYNGESIDKDCLHNSNAASLINLSSNSGSFYIKDMD